MKIKQKDFKSPPNHMQTLIDGTSCLGWVFSRGEDELREWGTGTLDQVRFYGNKVLQMAKEKDTAWYEAYLDLISSSIGFVVERAEHIADWTGKADGAVEFFNSVAPKAMQGNFDFTGPSSNMPEQVSSTQTKTKPVQVSGNAVDFKSAIDAGVKNLQ